MYVYMYIYIYTNDVHKYYRYFIISFYYIDLLSISSKSPYGVFLKQMHLQLFLILFYKCSTNYLFHVKIFRNISIFHYLFRAMQSKLKITYAVIILYQS